MDAAQSARNDIVSPLTGKPAARIGAIAVATIRDAYLRQYKIDVAPFLPDIEELEIRRCPDSGLEFFAPGPAGSPAFYEALYSADGADWAYQDEKWEFGVGAELLDGAQAVLDIGCGGGAFLQGLSARSRAGLETSRLGREAAQAKGLLVHDETVIQHARGEATYDAVTAFQVLEHVEVLGDFVAACVRLLRPGGRLILSVPNNDSFLKDCGVLPLNCPPHHVTLWNRRALEFLPSLFPIDIVRIEKEPLQPANLGWYQAAMEARYLSSSLLFRSFWRRFGGAAAFRRYLEAQRETIDGHTILAAYRKRDIR